MDNPVYESFRCFLDINPFAYGVDFSGDGCTHTTRGLCNTFTYSFLDETTNTFPPAMYKDYNLVQVSDDSFVSYQIGMLAALINWREMWTVELSSGLVLTANQYAQAQYTSGLSTARAGRDDMHLTDDTAPPITVTDASGNAISIKLSVAIAALIEYNIHLLTAKVPLYERYKSRIDTAKTIADLDAIVFSSVAIHSKSTDTFGGM